MNPTHFPGTQEASRIVELLADKRKILIVSHPNPDGDSVGSSLALYRMFTLKGLQASVIVPNAIPSYLQWLPGASDIIVYDQNPRVAAEIIQSSDLYFFIDFNSTNRLNDLGAVIQQFPRPIMVIDHHPQPAPIFDALFHTTEVSSTAELVYEFFRAAGFLDLVDKEIATCLYVGIMTDTGSFSYSCNYPNTYYVTADLIQKGLNANYIHNLVYDTFTEDRMRLLGHLLYNCMIVNHDLHTAYIYLSLSDQKRFNFQPGDAEGFVNYALSIQGIRFAAFFTEKENLIRISFRSKGNFSVNEFARTHFEGGGHRNAAGANSYKSLKDTIEYFEALLPQYADALCQES